jgi:spore germination protein KA
VNLSMLRRKLRTTDLKMEYKTFGTRSKTKACICYLGSLVNKDVLAELNKRLESFSIDGTLDVNYISEMIRDAPISPFKTIGSTERPDVVAAKLLEGRVALFLDGTPVVLTMPIFFIESFQSDDDYYLNYYFASIGRILRIMAFFIATSIPAIYIALVDFHQEMLPTPLLISISAARQGVPFPTVVEAICMLAVFELLRESGSRMPTMMGQALSIVGSLVIGQAAVEAKIVSAPIIIIAAASGIAGLMIPRLKGAIILLRLFALRFRTRALWLYVRGSCTGYPPL